MDYTNSKNLIENPTIYIYLVALVLKRYIDFKIKRHIVINEATMNRLAIFFLVMITLGLALFLALLGFATLKSNLLGWFLLITGLTYFFGVIIVHWIRRVQFWRPQVKGKVVKEEPNNLSFWGIVAGVMMAFYLPPIEYLYFKTANPQNIWLQIAGWAFILIGAALFIWARRTLGKFYSGHVSVVDSQPLVQSGPYHFIRHPAYAGYLLLALGITVGYASLGGLIVIPILLLPSVFYRLTVEDKLLAEHFGDQFREYTNKTARLIPGIW